MTAVRRFRMCSRAGSSGSWRSWWFLSSRSAARAKSGAGTKLRRTAFGSDLIQAVTSSSRRPGICQSKPSAVTWLSTGSGMWTVTPSASLPGSNW